jgi:hypothetical protein
VKEIEVWFPVSDCHAVLSFPGIPNPGTRNVWAELELVELVELVESVLAIAAAWSWSLIW